MTVIPVLAAVLVLGVLALGFAVLVRGRDRRPTRRYSYVSDAPPPALSKPSGSSAPSRPSEQETE